MPVSKFWDLQNLSTFHIFLFSGNSAAVFSCLFASWWEVARITLAFAQKSTRPRPPGKYETRLLRGQKQNGSPQGGGYKDKL